MTVSKANHRWGGRTVGPHILLLLLVLIGTLELKDLKKTWTNRNSKYNDNIFKGEVDLPQKDPSNLKRTLVVKRKSDIGFLKFGFTEECFVYSRETNDNYLKTSLKYNNCDVVGPRRNPPPQSRRWHRRTSFGRRRIRWPGGWWVTLTQIWEHRSSCRALRIVNHAFLNLKSCRNESPPHTHTSSLRWNDNELIIFILVHIYSGHTFLN